MKRFTETNKWRDPWFRALSSPAKQLWQYLCENCDAIGLIELNFKLTSADCGQTIKPEHITELGDRVQSLGKNRYFIPKFISFQYGELSGTCPPHKQILNLVRIHGLIRDGLAYRYPSTTLNSQVVGNQENQKGSVRVALPSRQDKTRQDPVSVCSEGVQGGGNGADPNLVPLPIRMTPKLGVPPSSLEVQATEAAFEKFYRAYPNQVNHDDALRAFVEVGGQNMLTTLLIAIQNQKEGLNWKRGIGIPNPANWLRDHRWTDKPRKPNPGLI